MVKTKKKLTTAQKRAKKKAKEERHKKYMWVFINGKQVKIKRPDTNDRVDPDVFIRNNADPIWLHQNEMWEYMDQGNNLMGIDEGSDLDSYIYNYGGKWKDHIP